MNDERIVEGSLEEPESSGGFSLKDVPGAKEAVIVGAAVVGGAMLIGADQVAMHWDTISTTVNAFIGGYWGWGVGFGALLTAPKPLTAGWRLYSKHQDHMETLAQRAADRKFLEAATASMQEGLPTKLERIGADGSRTLIESGIFTHPTMLPAANRREQLAIEPPRTEGGPAFKAPSVQECIDAVEPNNYDLAIGRDRNTGEMVVVPMYKRHLKVIGASQKGKSTAAAAMMRALTSTHDPELLQIALLDLENQTCHLFEDLPHVAVWGGQKLIARDPDEVLVRLSDIIEMLKYRYTLTKRQVVELPIVLVYLEELLSLKDQFKSRIKASRPFGKEAQNKALADYANLTLYIREIARRGLKARIQLLVCAQVDYRDDDLVEAWQNITSGVCFAVKPTAAMAAGFKETALLEVCAKEDKPGQFVAEFGSIYKGIVLSAFLELEKEIIAWEDAEEDREEAFHDAPTESFARPYIVGRSGELGMRSGAPSEHDLPASQDGPERFVEASVSSSNDGEYIAGEDVPQEGVNALVEPVPQAPTFIPRPKEDKVMTDLQIMLFKAFYENSGSISGSLSQIRNEKGEGLGNRYQRHASWLVKRYNLKKQA